MARNISNTKKGENGLAVLLKLFGTDIVQAVNVAYIAKVTKISPPTVSLQPLALTVGDNRKEALVESVPVMIPAISIGGKTPKVNLKVGDNVGCLVLDHDTTHYNGHGEFRQMTKTPHLVNNSLVIGKIAEAGDFSGN